MNQRMSENEGVAGQPGKAATSDGMKVLFRDHSRSWRDFSYVYPVVSRRSHGLSLGVNLNVNKACNFDCVYCCVDRKAPAARRDVDMAQLRHELKTLLEWAVSGEVWRDRAFSMAAPAYRKLADIAFSGDGEPTVHPLFDEALRAALELKREAGVESLPVVVITNATSLAKPAVRAALELLDAERDEVWGKLDAGTEAYYRQVDRGRVPFERALAGLRDCGSWRPVVIQTMLLKLDGEAMSDAEFGAYGDRLMELIAGGCRIRRVQLYTVARDTAERGVTALSDGEMDARAAQLRERLAGVGVEVFYGVG